MSEANHESAASIEKDSRQISDLQEISDYVRRDAFELIRHAKTGHIGGSSSSVELLVSLYFGGEFIFDTHDSKSEARDRVLIRGHEGPVRYPIFTLMGYMDKSELSTYRQYGSRLQGHEDMHVAPGVDITPSGSLGMLLSYGVGAAVELKESGRDNSIIVYLGDGEEQEGNVSEAARHATTLPLDNLICVIDKNGKQLSRPTTDADGSADLAKIWEGYGWDVLTIENGHDIPSILSAYRKAKASTKPICIIANTVKGYGISGAEDHYSGYHTVSVTDKGALDMAIDELNVKLAKTGAQERVSHHAQTLVGEPRKPAKVLPEYSAEAYQLSYEGNEHLDLDTARDRFYKDLGRQIVARANTAPFYMLSPDFVKVPDESELEVKNYARFYNTGIREQHTIAMAHGISVTNPDARILVHYWDSFAFRAMDQMNAAAQGGSSMLITGANAGLFQERNGGTHQSVGQPGGLLQIPGLTMYEPADVRDLYNVFSHSLTQNKGIDFARLHARSFKPLERESGDAYNIDAYLTHMSDKRPDITFVASGAPVRNSIQAAHILESEYGVTSSVINVINQNTLEQSLPGKLHEGVPVVTVYNGNPRILQSSVARAVMSSEEIAKPSRITGLGFEYGTTGKIDELERHMGIDAESLVREALKQLSERKS